MNEKTFYTLTIYDNEEENTINGETSDQYARIDYIKVAEADRGKGYGRALLKAAIAEAMTYGLPIYIVAEQLEATTDVERLVSFYETEGFFIHSYAGEGVVMTIKK